MITRHPGRGACAETRDPYVDGPRLQGVWRSDASACVHMSGLAILGDRRQDGFRTAGSYQGYGLEFRWVPRSVRLFVIARSHHLPLASWFATSGGHRRGGLLGLVGLAADHELPGDAGG